MQKPFFHLRAKTLFLILSFSLPSLLLAPSALAGSKTHSNKKAKDPSSFTSWLAKSKITGQFREYYFTKKFQNILPFRHSNSLGGWINIHTPSASGWSGDVGFATAQSLGLNSNAADTQVPSLPPTNLTVLEQAYIQYARYGLQVRAGDQPMETPLASTNLIDYRVIKPTYQGIGATYRATKDITLYAYRMFRFKGYTSSGYETLDTGKHHENFIAPIAQVKSGGFATYGMKWHHRGSTAQLWYYDFYNRLNTAFGEYTYHLGLGHPFLKAMLFGVQYAKQWNTGNQVLPYKDVNSSLYGAQIGFVVPHNIVFLAYNNVPNKPGSFRSGGFASPYQYGNYDTHTFYTDNFGTSLGSDVATPGHVYSIKDVLKFPREHLLFVGMYSLLHAPDQLIGSNGTFTGVGTAHTWEFVAKYGFAKDWSAKFLYVNIDNNSALGTIQIGRFFLTYTFPGA